MKASDLPNPGRDYQGLRFELAWAISRAQVAAAKGNSPEASKLKALIDAASTALGASVVDTVPGAPTIGTATGGNAQASVAFTAPASNGGTPITSYIATSTPGGFTKTGTASPLVVTGLTNGVAYTFKVKAVNAQGEGAESSASNSVTPSA